MTRRKHPLTARLRWGAARRVLPRDARLGAGLAIIGGLLLLGVVGPVLVGSAGLRLGAAAYSQSPTAAHPFGTDPTGRDVLALLVHGTIPTLMIGLLAGGIGTAIGVVLGLVSGYVRGPIDTVIRGVADVAVTIPTLMILVVFTALVRTQSIALMAIIIGLLAWPYSARAIRAQTLILRERGFVTIAVLSGRNAFEVMLLEILPNLLPYVAASLVGAVSGAIVAAVGLQLLGLGPITTPTIGLMLQYAFQYGAVTRGMWWWWGPPTLFLVLLFGGLFLISVAMDAFSNPRLRRVEGPR
jgi:peptide/nickel transport system permease protein